MGNLIHKYKKVVVSLVLAFFLSGFLLKNVFFADSQLIRPNFHVLLAARVRLVWQKIDPTRFLARFIKPEDVPEYVEYEELEKSLQTVAPGVSASSIGNYSLMEYDTNNVQWTSVKYTLGNGELIEVQYPDGTEPPPKELFESF